MTLRLSPEDQAEYLKLWTEGQADKEAAIAANNQKAAKQARQYLSHLYNQFKCREIPPEPEWRPMTLEERIQRIEDTLGITNIWTMGY